MANSSGFGLALGAIFAAIAIGTVVKVAEGLDFVGGELFDGKKSKGDSGLF